MCIHCMPTLITRCRAYAMARALVSLLSLLLLSAKTPIGVYAFTFLPSLVITANSCSKNSHSQHHVRRHATRALSTALRQDSSVKAEYDEDRLREEGVGGEGRTRLAESIAEEFKVRMDAVRHTYEARLEQERAAHRLGLAEQRVQLLEVSRVGGLRSAGVQGKGGGGGSGGRMPCMVHLVSDHLSIMLLCSSSSRVWKYRNEPTVAAVFCVGICGLHMAVVILNQFEVQQWCDTVNTAVLLIRGTRTRIDVHGNTDTVCMVYTCGRSR